MCSTKVSKYSFNSKACLRNRMQATSELKISSELLFGENSAEDTATEGFPAVDEEEA